MDNQFLLSLMSALSAIRTEGKLQTSEVWGQFHRCILRLHLLHPYLSLGALPHPSQALPLVFQDNLPIPQVPRALEWQSQFAQTLVPYSISCSRMF